MITSVPAYIIRDILRDLLQARTIGTCPVQPDISCDPSGALNWSDGQILFVAYDM